MVWDAATGVGSLTAGGCTGRTHRGSRHRADFAFGRRRLVHLHLLDEAGVQDERGGGGEGVRIPVIRRLVRCATVVGQGDILLT